MFIFQKDTETNNIDEKKVQILRNLIRRNDKYAIEFDEEDWGYRDEVLKRVVAYCWIGAGLVGIGGWNVRRMVRGGQIDKRQGLGVGLFIVGVTSLVMSRYYFSVKYDALDYVAQKYVVRQYGNSRGKK